MRAWPVDEKIAAADVHDTVIIPIMTEQRFTKAEETRARLTIIFEHNRFWHLREHPIKARRNAITTTHVMLTVVALHLAGPIDTLNHAARFGAPRGILRIARAIGNDEQFWGTRLPNALEHTCGQIGPLEY